PWQMHEDDRNGRIYVSDVGSDDWEELNVLSAGANFGWFLAEGPADPGNPAHVGFTDPLWAYPHFGIDPAATFEGCAIVGGAIYAPANATFPAEFFGKYLTADYCTGQMVAIDPATGQATPFMGGFDEIVDFAVHPTTGDVYYLDRSFRGDNQFPKGGVGKISYTGQVDQITFITQPSDVSIAAGSDATFFVSVSAPGNVTYQWTRDGVAVAGANSPQLVVPAVGPADDGARFAVRVTSGALTATSETATLTISANTAPVPSIQLTGGVADGYRAGTPIAFTGSATDAEDGAVPSASLTWEARLNHDIHDHGLVDGIVGASGSVTVPPEIETSTNVWVTIYLTATDSDGTSATTSVRVDPRVVTITLDTQPGGLSLMFEGAMVATPFTFDSVTGVTREFAAPATQVAGGVSYQFSSWSDGLGRNQPRTTPATDATFVATFDQVAAPDGCVITAGPAGGITLSWAAVGGETTYNIRNADGWVATVDGFLSYTDVDGTIDLDYLVRARPGGVTIDVPCVADDEPPPPPPVDGCTITAIPGGVRLDWQAVAGVDTFHIRNTNGWVADAVGTTTFTVAGGAVDAGYFVRHRLGPDVVDRPCTDEPPPPAQGCVATVVAGGVRLDWQPVDGIDLFHVRNNGGWVADVIGATTFTSPGAAVGDNFYVRHREGAEIIDRPCAQ
ncbi:MAG: hypothetical protein KDB16_19845, partial [Acidimicrobiales bacterium]|nr:hypothetical protein [Acidimicrobiales bacterium]